MAMMSEGVAEGFASLHRRMSDSTYVAIEQLATGGLGRLGARNRDVAADD